MYLLGRDPANGYAEAWFDRATLNRRARELASVYQHAKPFPHLAVCDLMPGALLEAVREECEQVHLDPPLITTSNRRQVKHETSDIERLGIYTRHLLGQLNSAPFVDFLEQVTGVRGLICDPHHHLAGLHETPQGGYGSIHSDFSYYPRLDVYHRLNVLIYLNADWPESYGGQLELWSADRSRAERIIQPTFGTVVLFETGPKTYHGLPTPIAGPPGTVRRSLANYYYTSHAPWSARRGLRGAVRRPGDDRRVAMPSATEFAHFALPRRAKVALRKAKRRVV